MSHSSEFYRGLFRKCNHDLRRCLNVLQGIKPLKEFDVDELVGILKKETVEEFKAIEFETYKNFVKNFLFQGFNFMQLVFQLVGLEGTDKQRAEFSKILGDCEFKSVQGCTDEICLEFLCLNYLNVYKK